MTFNPTPSSRTTSTFTHDLDTESVDHRRRMAGSELGQSTTEGESGFGPVLPVDLFEPVYGPAPDTTLVSFGAASWRSSANPRLPLGTEWVQR